MTRRLPAPARRVLWALAALALAAAAAVGLLVIAPAGADTTGGADTHGGFDAAAVDTLLSTHAAALRDRDRDAFDAGLDTAPASTAFRNAQLAAFDHADGVPFATFDLRYDRPVLGAGVMDAVRGRLGGSAAIVLARLSYAYAGVDARPAVHDQYLTVVHREDGWKLAADSDLAAEGGASWHGPWEFGPLVVVRGGSCLVLLHPADEGVTAVAGAQQLARGIAADTDAAVAAVSAVWGTGWAQRVAVTVAATQAELDTLAGPGRSLTAVAALAVAEPTTAVTAGPDLDAGQRLVLSGAVTPQLSAVGRAVLLRHELTHVATRAVTDARMPTWVVEGFADYIGNLAGAQPATVVAAELAARIGAAGLPATLPADTAFAVSAGGDGGASDGAGRDDGATTGTGSPGDTAAAAAYEQGWYAVRTVAALGGEVAPAAFYRAVATAVTAGTEPGAAVDAALRQTAGVDTAAFVARWRALMAAELAP